MRNALDDSASAIYPGARSGCSESMRLGRRRVSSNRGASRAGHSLHHLGERGLSRQLKNIIRQLIALLRSVRYPSQYLGGRLFSVELLQQMVQICNTIMFAEKSGESLTFIP